MTAFIRITLLSTAAFIVVEALPLAWFNFILCWVIVVGAAYRYPHLIIAKVQAMSSAVGYSIGLGAAIGALVNTLGMCGALLVHLILGATGATIQNDATANAGGVLSGISAIGDMFQIVGAPFVGALLGVTGGLVGGSTVPRSGAVVYYENPR